MSKSRTVTARRAGRSGRDLAMRREARRRPNPRLWYDVVAIALGVMAILIALALWRPGAAGPVGRILTMAGRLLVGHAVVLLPAALLAGAVALIIDYRRMVSGWVLIGVAGLMAMILGWLHLLHWPLGRGFDPAPHRIAALLGRPADAALVYAVDGGLVGALLGTVLQCFGRQGAQWVLGATGLASFLLITNLDLAEIGRRIRARSCRLAERARSRPKAVARERRPIVLNVAPTESATRLEAERARTGRSGLRGLFERIGDEPPPAEKPAEARARLPIRVVEGTSSPAPVRAGEYLLPPLDLLDPPAERPRRAVAETEANIAILENTLAQFRIEAQVVEIADGPTVTRYEIRLGEGIKVKKILDLADNIAMSLAAMSVRVEAPIPGKSAIGIEVPKQQPAVVTLRECLESEEAAQQAHPLCFVLGKDVAGRTRWADLSRMPHLLVAGATNSGKSVCLNVLIASLLFRTTPDRVKLLMIDPKRVELSLFEGVPHLCHPVVKDVKQAAGLLRWALKEMERRYDLFTRVMTRNIDGYNEKFQDDPEQQLPYIVVVIDELADLMMQQGAEVEQAICRLAQLARATGIHLVIATQRPSVDVITGLIKANIPSRVAFAVSSQVDSRTVLDAKGAESLIGRGDMLYKPVDAAKPIRIQGAFVSEKEINRLVQHLRGQGRPTYIAQPLTVDSAATEGPAPEEGEDELLEPAARFIVTTGHASTSMLQRKFKIGYTRAARLVDMLESRGVVGPLDGARPREILMSLSQVEEMFRSARQELFGRARAESYAEVLPELPDFADEEAGR